MSDNKNILWIVHYIPFNKTQEIQYTFYTDSGISYQRLWDIVCQKTSVVKFNNEKFIIYSRGPEASNVVINSDDAVTIALKFYGDEAFTKGIHINFRDFY